MTTEQAIQDVAMIARNGIDRVIELERDKARLEAEITRLRALSDEMFSTMVAALSLAPHGSGAYDVLDRAIKNLQPKWIRNGMEP
jgi:hypothetical protein